MTYDEVRAAVTAFEQDGLISAPTMQSYLDELTSHYDPVAYNNIDEAELLIDVKLYEELTEEA